LVNLPGPPVWSCLLQPRCLARRGCFHVAGHLLDRGNMPGLRVMIAAFSTHLIGDRLVMCA
jgi:hypothetical protein